MGFISTSIEPQRLGRMTVARERLLALMEDIGRSRVTTVSAPAGYGKTSAMMLWAQELAAQGRKVLWIAPRSGILTVEKFVSTLNAAFVQADFEWPALAGDHSPAEYIAELIAAQPVRPVLVIDDAQMIGRAVLDLVSEIVSIARDSLTTIIASRGAALIQVARLHALGLFYEVRTADLKFSLADAQEFLERNAVAMPEAELRALVDDTDGWAAGIAMACARSRFKSSGNIQQSAKMGPLSVDLEQYFAEEVMLPQTELVRNFIVSTAILDVLTPNSCVAVTERDDSRQMLEMITAAGLFIELVDVEKGVYVYHPLFRAMVLRRLNNFDPERAFGLNRRASRHFAAQGLPVLAIEHAAQAGDQGFLADQLDLLAEKLTYEGYLYRIDEMSAGIPCAVLATRPMLLLVLAWRSIRRLNIGAAERLIELAETHVEKQYTGGLLDDFRYMHLRRTIAHRQVMLDAALDDMPKVEQSAAKLLVELGDNYAYLSCTLLAQLRYA